MGTFVASLKESGFRRMPGVNDRKATACHGAGLAIGGRAVQRPSRAAGALATKRTPERACGARVESAEWTVAGDMRN